MHLRRLLFEKATANDLRRRREAFLRQVLDARLAAALEESDTITFPEACELLRRVYPIGPEGIATPPRRPSDFSFQRFGQAEEALAAIAASGPVGFGTGAILALVGVTEVWFETQKWLMPDVPLFVVDGPFVELQLEALWEAGGKRFFAFVSADVSKGCVMVPYPGIAWGERWETTYQVAAWGGH